MTDRDTAAAEDRTMEAARRSWASGIKVIGYPRSIRQALREAVAMVHERGLQDASEGRLFADHAGEKDCPNVWCRRFWPWVFDAEARADAERPLDAERLARAMRKSGYWYWNDPVDDHAAKVAAAYDLLSAPPAPARAGEETTK